MGHVGREGDPSGRSCQPISSSGADRLANLLSESGTAEGIPIHIGNHRDRRQLRRVAAITTSGSKWGQSEVPDRTARIWRGAHPKHSAKQRSRGATQEVDERDIATQLGACETERWAVSAAGESKPGQPSTTASTIRADTTSTWTTYGDHSLKQKGHQAPSDGEEHGADEARVGGHGEGVGTNGDREREGDEPGADDESNSD